MLIPYILSTAITALLQPTPLQADLLALMSSVHHQKVIYNSHIAYLLCHITIDPSDAPQSVVVRALNPMSVLVSWQPPLPEHRNGIIVGYAVRMIGLHSDNNIDFPLTNETEMVVEGLHPFYTYTFSVAAFTVGLGPFSNAVSQVLPESG